MTPLEDSLARALADARISALPPARRPLDRRPWLRAVVLVDKVVSSNYALASSDGESLSIDQDYGRPLPIRRIRSIHPYVLVEPGILPRLRTDQENADYVAAAGRASADEVLALLSAEGKTPEQALADRQRVNSMVAGIAMRKGKGRISVDREIIRQVGSLYPDSPGCPPPL